MDCLLSMITCTQHLKVSGKEINVTVVEELLNQPENNVNMTLFDMDRPFRNHTTFLCIAVRNRDEELIDYLINRKADVNKGDLIFEDENPLHIAVENGDLKVFQKLYQLGAKLHLQTSLRRSLSRDTSES
ncbi:Protein of unknown function [Cotesia congregata]|uniref:Uncharacterized protein n=1 Tax=Cotesia congregata TaxID=51543 RepID=A0A8J2H9E7_COTCN|nr:Protein of unknown function [Cotesia congregata]